MISVQEAYPLISQHVSPLPPETVDLADAVGRVLVASIIADVDSPPHRKSVMDGFAVRSADINSGNRRLRVIDTVVAGDFPRKKVATGEATRVMTGAPMPEGADAMVMVERTESSTCEGQEWVVIELDSLPPNRHTMDRAENFAVGQTVFSTGHRVRPSDVGLLAEVGAHQIQVGRLPSVAVLPTGDELVDCSQRPGKGQIRNSNGPMLIAMMKQMGLEITDLGIGHDQKKALKEKILAGLQHDLLVLSGGVSAGVLDLVPHILEEAGVVQVFHKVEMKPGKPIWFGGLERDGHRCCVFGLPGNPVSSLVGFHLFVRTAIGHLESCISPRPKSFMATLTAPHQTRGDRPTYWPGRWVENTSIQRGVEPLVWRGSSDLLALGSADGLIHFPGETHEHERGKEVAFFPLL